MELKEMEFKELNDYLISHSVFGFTVSRRKNVLIYTFKRYFNAINLLIKVKVNRETKRVISIMHNDNTYTDFENVKSIVGKWQHL